MSPARPGTDGTVRVRFLPAGREVELPRGAWLTAAAVRAGVGLVFDCDGQGLCATCRIRIVEGVEHVPPVQAAERVQLGEEVEGGWRLACLLRVEGDVTVEVPPPDFAYPPRLQR